jgi:hypothetical protein
VSSPTADPDEGFHPLFLPYGQYAGVQMLLGWYCLRCGVLVPNVTDMPPELDDPRDVHRAWHEENDHARPL